MEKVAEAKVLIVEMVCDECGKGIMRPRGNITLSSFPEQYPHECSRCGHIGNLLRKYPYQKLVPIEYLRDAADSEICGTEFGDGHGD